MRTGMMTLLSPLLLAIAACTDGGAGDNSWEREVASAAKSSTTSNESTATGGNENPENGSDQQATGPTTGCGRFFYGGSAPRITDQRMWQAIEPSYHALCYRAFAVGYSGLTRTPIFSAETLDATQLNLARQMTRNSEFTIETRIPAEHRATLEDYRGSGYDRGHMAPSADMPSMAAQAESFVLTNIAPQNGALNQGRWADLEQSVRRQSMRSRSYIVTGPIFKNARQAINRRVLIPTAFYKAVLVEGRGATVFVASNEARARWASYTVDQFQQIYGIDVYPALPAGVRRLNASITSVPQAAWSGAEAQGQESQDSQSSGQPQRDAQGCVIGARYVLSPNGVDYMTENEYVSRFGSKPAPDKYHGGCPPQHLRSNS